MEWEQCKENVKPKREGRTVSNITTPLKGNAAIAEIQERQADFEREIKEYEGDDELEVWDRYVRYMDNAYPEGEWHSKVCTIQFRLARKFMHVDKYKNDVRLLNTYIDFANHAKDAISIYGFCYYHKIGIGFPRLWINWINAFIHKGLHDKAWKLVNKALVVFPNYYLLKGLRLQIMKLMDEADSLPTTPNVRSVGSTLSADNSQAQRPGPRHTSSKPKGSNFNVMRDKDVHTTHIPSTTCNPLERTKLNKENASRVPQRWKNCAIYTDTPQRDQSGVKFDVFEEEAVPTGKIIPRQTTALTTKKVTQQVKSVESFEQGVNSKTGGMETVAYSKSAVYPRGGGEWSFEEIWARYRYLKHQEDESNKSSTDDESLEDRLTEGRKRSSSTEFDIVEDKKQCKESSITVNNNKHLAETSITTKMPLKSCLTPRSNIHLPSNFSVDFAPENIASSSTRIVQVEEVHQNQEAFNDVLFSDSPIMKPVRPKLSEINTINKTRAPIKFIEQSTMKYQDETGGSVGSAVPHVISQNVIKSIENDNFYDGPDSDSNQQFTDALFTLNNLENTLSMGDRNSNFDVFEDPTAMQRKVLNEVEPILDLSCRKKLLVESLEEPHESKLDNSALNIFSDGEKSITSNRKASETEFEIFKDERSPKLEELSKSKSGFSIYSDMNKISKPRRESLAFDIFSDNPDSTNDYHLKTIIKTPCPDKSSSMGSVPWTWGKINEKNASKDDTAQIREYTKSNTMKINQQAIGVLNGDSETDFSIIENSIESVPVNPKPILKEYPLSSYKYDKPKVCFVQSPHSNNMLTTKSMDKSLESETGMVHVTEIFDGSGVQDNLSDSSDTSLEKYISGSVRGLVQHQLSTVEEQSIIVSQQTSIELTDRALTNNIDVDAVKQLIPILEDSMDSHVSSNNSSKENTSELGASKSICMEEKSYTVVTAEINAKKQLTPILEGSMDSHASSNNSSKENTSELGASKSIMDEHSCITSSFHHKELNTPVISTNNFTAKVRSRISDEKTTTFVKPMGTLKESKLLHPDKTQRDVCCDHSYLKMVPRYSIAPKEPVSNPYDQDLINNIIQSLDPPLFYRTCFHKYDENLDIKYDKKLKTHDLNLGKMYVTDIKQIGEGAYAKVYKGNCHGDSNKSLKRAFKVQSPSCPWEFYILSEVSERMKLNNTPSEFTDMILTGLSMHVYRNMSVLVTPCFTEGSLLDMVNVYRIHSPRSDVPEVVILTYALDMLRCVQALHNIGIIHGDIKPDNWLLRDKDNTTNSMSTMCTKSVVLIDFGRSIDMKLMPPGSQFTSSCNTDFFECVEMLTHRPWTYQIDYFGVLSCIYLLFHNDYMKVEFNKNDDKWQPICRPPRRVNKDLFEKMFSELLNIKNCESIPPLDEYISNLEDYLKSIYFAERHKQLKRHYSFVMNPSPNII